MKREALLRELRKIARDRALEIEIIKTRGKGSHYRVRIGPNWTTVQSGELTPLHVRRIKQQLGLN